LNSGGLGVPASSSAFSAKNKHSSSDSAAKNSKSDRTADATHLPAKKQDKSPAPA
jgi:hypothetical protein